LIQIHFSFKVPYPKGKIPQKLSDKNFSAQYSAQ